MHRPSHNVGIRVCARNVSAGVAPDILVTVSGYFGHSIFPLLAFSGWVRYWLLLRLYPKKVYFVGKKPYLTEALTTKEKTIIFSVHLVLLFVMASAAILIFIGVTRLIYG